jgi:hypothetical protein
MTDQKINRRNFEASRKTLAAFWSRPSKEKIQKEIPPPFTFDEKCILNYGMVVGFISGVFVTLCFLTLIYST